MSDTQMSKAKKTTISNERKKTPKVKVYKKK